MTPEQRQRVEGWFDELIEASAEVRRKELARYEAIDPQAASEVRRLVEGLDLVESRQVFGTGLIPERVQRGRPGGLRARTLPRADANRRRRLWRCLQGLARGGPACGRRWPSSSCGLRRGTRGRRELFEQERQILADLDHAAIAKLLDGGTTAEGTPYLVMEFIEGRPITEYCDQAQLAIAERLRLFQNVCEAVSYAHRKQILHRDVKPANVFVTAGGDVKLLDFGIAKLTDPARNRGLETARGSAFFTKTHASPEQIRGERLSVGADIYSLGVLLYELLSGHLPFSLERVHQADWKALLLEAPPTPPSEMIEGGTGSYFQDVQKITTSRRAGVKELKRRLRGDLDAIVLKALSKDANRRFSTVRALRDDIERYLVNLPVEARRRTALYQFSKAIRRAPALSATFLLAFLVFLGGFGRHLVLGAQVGWQRYLDAVVIEQTRGLLYSETLPAYTSLASIDGSAEARRAFRQTWSELLERFERLPDGELAELQPDLGFAWLKAGAAHYDAGEFDAAEAAFDHAVARFQRLDASLRQARADLPIVAGGTEAFRRRREQYGELYRQSLQARARLLRQLGREAEAARDEAALRELEP